MANSNYVAGDWSPIDMAQKAWAAMAPHLVILVGVSLAVTVVQFGISFAFGLVEGLISAAAAEMANQRGGDAAQLVAVGVRAVVGLGRMIITLPLTVLTTGALARMALTTARGGTPDLGAFSLSLSRLLPMLAGSLVVGFLTAFGFVFCILPGIVVALALQFFTLALMDTELGPIQAVKYSWALARPQLLNLVVFAIGLGVAALIVTCGTCGLGLLIVQPFGLVCQAMVYVHLSGRTEDFLPAPAV